MTKALVSCAMAVLLSLSPAVGQTLQAVPPGSAAQPGDQGHVLQDGTPVKLQLSNALSSADAKAGQEISFEVVDDIDIDGVTVLHRGAVAMGVVTEAAASKRMGRAGKLNFTIASVQLADNEKAALRAVNDAKGDSKVAGMTALMVSMPMVAAPFFLLVKGGNSAIPKGTQITAFVDGDMRLDLAKFGAAPTAAATAPVTATVTMAAPAAATTAQASLVIESTPAGADIEMDGAFVGNTPSTVGAAPGSHRISVRKKGFTDWNKTLSVTSGTVRVSAVLEQTQ